MTFYEFTRLPSTPEREMLLQAIAIISGQPGFTHKSPGMIFDIVAKQAADIKPAYCTNCRKAGEPAEGLWPLPGGGLTANDTSG